MEEAPMRVSPEEFQRLDLAAHAILGDVPLSDVSVVDLPGGGPGRTLADVRALGGEERLTRANPIVRALFGLRGALGRALGWDRPAGAAGDRATSYLHRLDDDLKRRSAIAPGTPEGSFSLLYLLDRESLTEIQNATVHAFLAQALVESPSGYRLYWAVYVKPVSRFTRLYMGAIEPFRRFIVYPSILGRIRTAWQARFQSA
jgi:hypothetical protein